MNAFKTQNGCSFRATAGMAALAWLTFVSAPNFAFSAQAPDADGAEVQTRGPVHEAFAGIVTYNPEPGVTVSKAPPEPIEELPPEEKPEGDNVTWIPGYWSWDDERKDYLWISGTWRALPPGRAWIAGYWAKAGQGYQWTSGYWADSAQKESTYLPAPPATIEAGPNVAAPSPDYVWMPGCWTWSYDHYAWRPGYWVMGRPDWDWVPSYYVWTPRGYILAGGYWDYPVERRGVIFAPVYFEPRVYAHRHYVYSPSIVISLGVFSDHLFCRPRYHHYYFGDYYAPAYVSSGFYASFSFHIGRHGYDPIYSHHRWHHRNDRDWNRRLEVSYRNRRDHADARPPRTWAQQNNVTINNTTINRTTVNNTTINNNTVIATTLDQDRQRANNPVRYQKVDRNERQTLAQRTREVQTARQERQTIEARVQEAPNPGAPTGTRTGPGVGAGTRASQGKAVRAEAPKSVIASKPIRELAPKDAPPSPQQAPRTESVAKPTQERDRAPSPQQGGRGRNQVRDNAPATQSPSTPSLTTPSPAPAPGRPQRQPEQPKDQKPKDRKAPATPQEERRVPVREPIQPTPTTPQTERRAPAQPQPQPPREPAVTAPNRPVQPPGQVQREQRVPQRERERGLPPGASDRSGTPPVGAPAPGQPNPRAVETPRVPPGQQRQARPQRSDQKGAERLRPDNR